MVYFNIHLFTNRCCYLLYSGIAEFHHFSTFDTNNMVVLFKFKRSFELGGISSELMFCNKVAGKKKFDGVIKSGSAYTVFLVFHIDIKGFDIKMSLLKVYFS